MVLIAIDRVAESVGKKLRSPTDRTFLAWLDQLLKAQCEAVKESARRERLPLFPSIPVVGVVLTSAVFLDHQGILMPFSQTGPFWTGDEADPLIVELKLKRALGETIPIGRELPPSFGAMRDLPPL